MCSPTSLSFCFVSTLCSGAGDIICSPTTKDTHDTDRVHLGRALLQLRLFFGGTLCQQLRHALSDEELGQDECQYGQAGG